MQPVQFRNYHTFELTKSNELHPINMSRSLIIVLISLFISEAFAQRTVPPKKKSVGAQTQAFLGTDGDTCLRKEFSIVFYIIQDTSGKRTPARLNNHMDSVVRGLNLAFSRIC